MRLRLAVLLARTAARLVAGRDDRVVLLNHTRRRSTKGNDVGRVHAFVCHLDGDVIAWAPGDFPKGLGLPVPQVVARLAGKTVRPFDV